jgi:ABC-type Fe3+/spermidine/putrescine transport system ATPase subunit
MPSFLSINELHKRFGDLSVLREVSLDIDEGEIVVLLGPSGSGKTTLLRLLAGFETPTAGSIQIVEEEISALPANRRNFGMVFQHYALFPHLTVAQNVAFGLESRRLPKHEISARVKEVLPLVDLGGFEARRIHEISGGQQQRVALARALAPEPRVLLLDEPLSNLDPALRERTRRHLKNLIRKVGITALWVTHEQDEAFYIGDRVALLNEGRLEQVGTPEELYFDPASRFVAEFVGRASLISGVLRDDRKTLEIGDQQAGQQSVVWKGSPAPAVGAADEIEPGDRVVLIIRPEVLALSGVEEEGSISGKIVERQFSGESTYYAVHLAIGEQVWVRSHEGVGQVGERVWVHLDEQRPAPKAFKLDLDRNR